MKLQLDGNFSEIFLIQEEFMSVVRRALEQEALTLEKKMESGLYCAGCKFLQSRIKIHISLLFQ